MKNITPHQALYRKYRPHTFKEVVGQEQAVIALEGAIKNKKISHAYLFSGSRGTGKTSIARIFADTLGVSPDDIYEIDAASHTSVENIKELNDGVYTLPFRSDYKIYILDEVHMLSKSAWNAFLKTLEEPPAHVIFILATTEIEKVPDTILSRCQTFIFKKPSRAVLKEVIEDAAKKEEVKLEEGVSDLIALFGDGSFRDSYGTLEKIISASNDKKISLSEAETILGAPKESLMQSLVDAIVSKDAPEALKIIKKLQEKGIDMIKCAEILIERFRSLLLSSVTTPDLPKNPVISSQTLLRLLSAYQDMKMSPLAELPLELAVIDIASK